MVKEIMAQLRRPPPLPVLCLGMLWRTELAGCAQRDSAEPVKQSGVREGQRCRRSPLSLSLPQPLFRGRSMGSKLPSPSHIGCLQRGASRLHWLGTRAAAAVSGSLREKPELRASIIVINQVKTTHLWALYMPLQCTSGEGLTPFLAVGSIDRH